MALDDAADRGRAEADFLAELRPGQTVAADQSPNSLTQSIHGGDLSWLKDVASIYFQGSLFGQPVRAGAKSTCKLKRRGAFIEEFGLGDELRCPLSQLQTDSIYLSIRILSLF